MARRKSASYAKKVLVIHSLNYYMFFKIAETLATIDYTHYTYFLLLFKGGGIKKIKKEYSKEKTQKSV